MSHKRSCASSLEQRDGILSIAAIKPSVTATERRHWNLETGKTYRYKAFASHISSIPGKLRRASVFPPDQFITSKAHSWHFPGIFNAFY
jgi:hypothetical protein